VPLVTSPRSASGLRSSLGLDLDELRLDPPGGDGAGLHEDGRVRELRHHLLAVRDALGWLDRQLGVVTSWADELADVLTTGGRVLVAGNGGSAALAQHLTSELVGRYHRERPAFSALALTADTSTVTALGNDYGFEECFARQVAAHGRPGDILVTLSSSGRSPNLLRAAQTAGESGLASWAMTGPAPNPLAELSDRVLAVPAALTATVQEVQQVAVHLLCRAFDARVAPTGPVASVGAGGRATAMPADPPRPAPAGAR
jgi:D-sedoheptulose 7-phosphate isomerase